MIALAGVVELVPSNMCRFLPVELYGTVLRRTPGERGAAGSWSARGRHRMLLEPARLQERLDAEMIRCIAAWDAAAAWAEGTVLGPTSWLASRARMTAPRGRAARHVGPAGAGARRHRGGPGRGRGDAPAGRVVGGRGPPTRRRVRGARDDPAPRGAHRRGAGLPQVHAPLARARRRRAIGAATPRSVRAARVHALPDNWWQRRQRISRSRGIGDRVEGARCAPTGRPGPQCSTSPIRRAAACRCPRPHGGAVAGRHVARLAADRRRRNPGRARDPRPASARRARPPALRHRGLRARIPHVTAERLTCDCALRAAW